MGRKLKDASVAVGDSAGTGTNSAPAGYNTGAGSTSGRKLQDAVVGTGDGGAAVSVRHAWASALILLVSAGFAKWCVLQICRFAMLVTCKYERFAELDVVVVHHVTLC